MRLAPLALLSCFALLPLTGCPSDDDDTGVPQDSGADAGSTSLDAKVDAGGNQEDTGTGTSDAGDEEADASGMDALVDTGVPAGDTLFPGVGVLIGANRIDVGTDTFESVNTKLTGITRVRTAVDSARSYAYTLPSGTVTIWYANNNFDDDGMAPMDVDGTDAVLWIAVEDGFPGTTPDGVGLDSTRADVEGAYGAPPHTVDIANPAGTLAQYYTDGILVAYEPNDEVRTITISRAYAREPNGTIDAANASVTFGAAGALQGSRGIGSPGTNVDDVRALLGEPDAEGQVDLNGTTLDTLSYGFFGIEVFFLTISENTFFFVVHPPFYGTAAGDIGMGSTRAEMETYLTGLGYNAQASSNPQLICYDRGSPPMVGVTYTATDNVVSSITLALPACP